MVWSPACFIRKAALSSRLTEFIGNPNSSENRNSLFGRESIDRIHFSRRPLVDTPPPGFGSIIGG